MRRKLIKQGGTGLTVYLPKKWIDQKALKAGDEVEIIEDENALKITSTKTKKLPKATQISVDLESFNLYRGLLGALYRSGYDQIKVLFKNRKVIPKLQETVNTFYGFEIFEISEKSCLIKSMYNEEATNISSHYQKMIHIIKTMQNIITEDIKGESFESKSELLEFRRAVLKQRDIIKRIIVQNKLHQNNSLPYYLLSQNLWNIARNYYNLYIAISQEYSLKETDSKFLEKINKYFDFFFTKTKNHQFSEKHKKYRELSNKAIRYLKGKEQSILISYCLNILMIIQSSNSYLLLLNYKEEKK